MNKMEDKVMTYVLSISMMEKLEELGIDTSCASASYSKFGKGDDSFWMVNLGSLDQPLTNTERMRAFTVTDLLDILPESITSEDGVVHHLSIKKCDKVEGWEVSYTNPHLFSVATTFLIDAAYGTLLYLLEHEYLKTKNTEK